jgi:hypothetical protein
MNISLTTAGEPCLKPRQIPAELVIENSTNGIGRSGIGEELRPLPAGLFMEEEGLSSSKTKIDYEK